MDSLFESSLLCFKPEVNLPIRSPARHWGLGTDSGRQVAQAMAARPRRAVGAYTPRPSCCRAMVPDFPPPRNQQFVLPAASCRTVGLAAPRSARRHSIATSYRFSIP